MDTLYDYKRFAILYVDDEEKSLKYFTRAFGDTFRIFTAPNAEEGYRLLEANADSIGVVMSDQRMPGEKGVQFLQKARALRPRIIRVLATAFTDLDAAIDAVNSGAIYKYITKPWEVPTLETTLKRCLEFFMVQRERDSLLREKLSVLHNLVITDRVLSLGVLAAGLGSRFRNSMSAVRGFLELAPEIIQGQSMDLAQLREPDFWEQFHRQVQARVRLIVDLLGGLPPPESGAGGVAEARSQVDVATVIRRLAASLEPEFQKRGIRLQADLPVDLPAIHSSPARLEHLFGLMLRNELHHVSEGGSVTLSGRHGTLTGGTRPAVEFDIADDGPGLPREAILSIFNPFIVRQSGAHEYGLHLMAGFFAVHHLGGEIQVLPEDNGGTRIRLVLPLEPGPADSADGAEVFLVNAMTNDRLWEKLLGGA